MTGGGQQHTRPHLQDVAEGKVVSEVTAETANRPMSGARAGVRRVGKGGAEEAASVREDGKATESTDIRRAQRASRFRRRCSKLES